MENKQSSKILNNPLPPEVYVNEYHKPSIRIGTVFYLVAFVLSFLPAVTLWAVYDTIPSFSQIVSVAAAIISASIAWWIVEPISYFTVLGTAGTYMSFLVGSMNTRIPCAIAAQSVTDSEPGSQRGEIMATLGIAGSVVTSVVFVSLGAVCGSFLLGNLSETITASFQYVPAAMYATMFAGTIGKRPDLIGFGVITALLLLKFGVLVIPGSLLLLTNVVLCVLFGLFLYQQFHRI